MSKKKLKRRINYIECEIMLIIELCEEYEDMYAQDDRYLYLNKKLDILKKQLKKVKKYANNKK